MQKINPYEAPASPAKSVRNPRRFDAGFLTGRYLQVLAGLWVFALMFEWLCFRRLNLDFLDLSPALLFWAARNLIRHGNRTRKFVVWFCFLVLIVDLILLVVAVVFGTDQIEISYPGLKIKNPAFWQVALSVLTWVLVFGIPLWLLLSPEAREQFKASSDQFSLIK